MDLQARHAVYDNKESCTIIFIKIFAVFTFILQLLTPGMPRTDDILQLLNLILRHTNLLKTYVIVLTVCHSETSRSARFVHPNKVLPPTLSVSQFGSTEAIVSDASHPAPKQVWALTFLL